MARGQRNGLFPPRSYSKDRTLWDCFKCGSSKHQAIACLFAKRAFEYAKKLRVRQDGEESDEDQKTY